MMLVLTFIFTLAVSVAAMLYATRQPVSKKVIQERLSNLQARLVEGDPEPIELSAKSKPQFSDLVTDGLKSYRFGGSLERLIQHAGSSMSLGRVMMVSAAAALTFSLVVYWLAGSLLIALPAGLVGALAPYLLLRFQKGRRLKKFGEALPDAIDLMARALRAGHSTASSIEVIAEQSPEPLASEFATCFQQQKFGIPFRDALLAMGERVPSDDLQFLITAVLIQKETGGDLTDILDRTTAVIRDRIRVHGEVRTRTAQGRMTGWILSALPLVLSVVINVISPGYSHVLFYDPLGQKLVIAGVVFIGIGAFIISRIVDIRV